MSPLLSITIGIIALLTGKRINQFVPAFHRLSVPPSVTGGLLFSLITLAIHSIWSISLDFDLNARDFLLVYFFTTVGINSRISDLRRGGKSFVYLIIILTIFIILQNITGIAMASMMGLQSSIGLILGTVSLVGGHGVTIAWSPSFSETFRLSNAMEIGVTASTIGLILGSLTGGPIANFLIKKHKLRPPTGQRSPLTESSKIKDKLEQPMKSKFQAETISYQSILAAAFAINICVIAGQAANSTLAWLGIQLPLFLPCMIIGIVTSNSIRASKQLTHWLDWQQRTPTLDLVLELSMGIFLSMSLVSLHLWSLAEHLPLVLPIIIVQLVLAIVVNIYIIFPAMGRNYDAAVICAGFGGISIGSTAAGISNMTAVTQNYGASNKGFVIIPMVSAFFLEIFNSAIAIPSFIAYLSAQSL